MARTVLRALAIGRAQHPSLAIAAARAGDNNA
jgi:hypothetical protein